MAIGSPTKKVGSVGRRGKRAGQLGRDKTIHGSSLTPDQDNPKVYYPTGVTGTTTTAPPTTTTTS